MEEAVQGGVDPREDWDQAAAAAWAPGAPPTSQPVARRCPRPPRLLQARYVGVDGGLCVYVHVCAWRGRGGEKGRGGVWEEEGAGTQIQISFGPSRDRKWPWGLLGVVVPGPALQPRRVLSLGASAAPGPRLAREEELRTEPPDLVRPLVRFPFVWSHEPG